jgi:Tol biopolymer transport system component
MKIIHILCAAALGACTSPASSRGEALAALDWPALRAVVDGPDGEAWVSFHPSGKAVVFGRNTKDWKDHRVWVTRLVDGKWTPAEMAAFTKEYNATSARFSADGKSVLFSSSRPLPPELRVQPKDGDKDQNIWRAPWDGERFSEAVPVTGINTPWAEIEAVEVANGTIYVSSTKSKEFNPKNNVDIYKAVPKSDGTYTITLADAVNTDHTESTQYVTPDESLILFSRSHDPSGLGEDDIFVSYNRNGKWSAPVHLGGEVNSEAYEYGPELTPDGKTLLVTTHRSGQAGIIAVPMLSAK